MSIELVSREMKEEKGENTLRDVDGEAGWAHAEVIDLFLGGYDLLGYGIDVGDQ